MSHQTFLKLVSMNGESVQGWSKDPAWPGWIPLKSLGFEVGNTSGWGSGASVSAHVLKEVHLSADMAAVDGTALTQWLLKDTRGTATVNFVPDAVGKYGQSYIFSEVEIGYLRMSGKVVEFSFKYTKMEHRQSIRFR